METNKPILLVEDDQVDAMTVRRAFKDVHITNNLEVAGNGLEALDFLQNSNNPNPCIILLDLNMPKMNGIEFLKHIKKDDNLKIIPVVVLTTSEEEQDRVDSYNLGVAGYILKPVDYRKFLDVVKTIDLYWTLCILP
ncbi:MAG: response regulator [Candidatus Aminicenantaceae bacterium]